MTSCVAFDLERQQVLGRWTALDAALDRNPDRMMASGVDWAGDQEAEGAGNDAKFHRQARQRFAIDLRVDRLRLDRVARQAVGPPGIDTLCLPQNREPKYWPIAQIFLPAPRS